MATYTGTSGSNVSSHGGSSGNVRGTPYSISESNSGAITFGNTELQGADFLDGQGGDDLLQGYGGADTIFGGSGNDVIFGDVRPEKAGLSTQPDLGDLLYGGDGDDLISGQGGDDYIDPGSGTNVVDGGAGIDRVAYIGATQGVTVDLAAGTAEAGSYASDRLYDIEDVAGSNFADSITGSSGDNVLAGYGGDDTMDGGAGTDTALFSGDRAFYTARFVPGGAIQITDNRSQAQIDADSVHSVYRVSNGTDTLTGFELFKFKDATYTFSDLFPDDYGNTPGSSSPGTGTITAGGTATGTIEIPQDVDVFAVTLEEGVEYTFDLYGEHSGQGTLFDPLLTLLAGNGSFIDSNDDGGLIRESRLIFTPAAAGTYHLVAGAFSDYTGSYTLAVSEPSNHAPAGSVIVTGTVRQGQKVTADTSGLTDADGLGAFSYQWLRGGLEIAGAAGRWHLVNQADVGEPLAVRVTYTDGGGTAEAVTSAETVPAENVNDAPAGSLLVSGTVQQGQKVAADASGLTDADGLGAFSYQWLRGGVEIAGAVGRWHLVNQADVGEPLAVRVTYTDGGGTVETVTSAATAPALNVNDAPAGSAVIAGTVRQGEKLSADLSGLTDADGLGAFSYQWLRGGVEIAGAVGRWHLVNQADAGQALAVRVTYTDGGGTAETVTSGATAPAQNVNDAPTGQLALTGTAVVGKTVATGPGTLADADGLGALAYQWLRDGAEIAGATGRTHLVNNADAGATLAVRATYTDGFGTVETVIRAFGGKAAFPDLVKIGTDAADIIEGGGGNDTLSGLAGSDTIYGRGGNDRMYGGDQYDTLYGEDGNDQVWGGNGRDTVYLGAGNDVFRDTPQNDAHGGDNVFGGSGDDRIFGRGGEDTFFGEAGNDLIRGGIGNDKIYGGDGGDTLHGDDGRDTVWGGNGRDTVYLGAGNDIFWDTTETGPGGDDTISGGDGSDSIQFGGGSNRATGGAGGDSFLFNRVVQTGSNVITDFAQGADLLKMKGIAFADLALSATGSGVLIEWDSGSVKLEGIKIGLVSLDDFIFS